MARPNPKLPKEQLVEPEARTRISDTEGDDVEGHGMPLTPPPAMPHRGPGHGGEVIQRATDEDDVEGHRRA